MQSVFENEFLGMTMEAVTYAELEKTRKQIHAKLMRSFLPEERDFILSLVDGNPAFNLLGIEDIDGLPGIKWKVQNIRKMDAKKRRKEVEEIQKILLV
jgi:hypothetical protein